MKRLLDLLIHNTFCVTATSFHTSQWGDMKVITECLNLCKTAMIGRVIMRTGMLEIL